MYRRRPNSKYGNKPVVIDGIRFDSQKEGDRWCDLLLMQKVGVISDLHDGKKIRPIQYVADFVYNEGKQQVVEDVKGVKTQEYKLKKKMMLYQYGIEIKEV